MQLTTQNIHKTDIGKGRCFKRKLEFECGDHGIVPERVGGGICLIPWEDSFTKLYNKAENKRNGKEEETSGQ